MQDKLVQRLLLRSTAMVLVMLSVLGGALDLLLQYRLAESTRELGQGLARQTAEAAAQMTLANDLLGMNVLLTRLQESAQVRSAHIFSIDNRLLASAGPAPLLPLDDRPLPQAGRRSLDPVLVESIAVQNVLAGYLRLEWDGRESRATLIWFRLLYLGSSLLMLVIGMALVLRHALALQEALQQARRALQGMPEIAGHAEPVHGLQGLTALSRHILERRALAATSAPRQTTGASSLLIMEPAAMRRLLEQFEPEQVNRHLRRAYQLVQRCAELHHARLVRIENNRILVVFSDQGEEPAHMYALRCGRLFLMLLDSLRRQHSEHGNPPLQFRGAVIAPEETLDTADLQIDPGQPLGLRLQQQARLGSRLLGHADAGELVLSEDALNAADELGEVLLLGDARKAEMRDRNAPIHLYPLLGLPPGQQILLEKQQDNLLSSAAL